MNKKKHDIGKIAVKITAGILALFMVLGVAGTLIVYVLSMIK